jgi:hypothetical protein
MGGERIIVQPGLAIDSHGREIHINEELTITVPSASLSPAWVVVQYVERFVNPVPVSTDGSMEPTFIEEGCNIIVASSSCENGVAVARLVREQDGWRIDSSFVPARPR